MTADRDSIQWSVDSMTASWLKRIEAGDGDAWERLDGAYRKLVLWWCLKGGLRHQDAEDVVQEVFLDVRRNIINYHQESFLGWLWTITRRRMVDSWRKQQLDHIYFGPSLDESVRYIESLESDSLASSDEVTKIVFDAIIAFVEREFSRIHWQAFWKVLVEGKKPAEVAAELGISRTVVHNATSRIRRRIREEFGEWT